MWLLPLPWAPLSSVLHLGTVFLPLARSVLPLPLSLSYKSAPFSPLFFTAPQFRIRLSYHSLLGCQESQDLAFPLAESNNSGLQRWVQPPLLDQELGILVLITHP